MSLLEELRKSRLSRLPLKPDTQIQLIMDFLCLIMLLADSFAVPYIVAWAPPLEGGLLAFVICGTSFWTVDFVRACLTGYYLPEDSSLCSLGQAFLRYLKGWFFIDLAIVCLDVTGILIETTGEGYQRAFAFR